MVEFAYYQLYRGPVDAPPTPPLYLHLPDGSRRSGSWSNAYYQLFIHSVIFIVFSVTKVMLSWAFSLSRLKTIVKKLNGAHSLCFAFCQRDSTQRTLFR